MKLDRVGFSPINLHAINHNSEREDKMLICKSSFLKRQKNMNNMNKRHTLLYSLIPYNSPKVNIMSVKIDVITYFKSVA